jgi:hypothetical protein
LLIGLGVLLIVAGGLLVWLGPAGGTVPVPGRLPGDVHIQREHWSIYVPLTTSLLISVILTLLLAFLFRR